MARDALTIDELAAVLDRRGLTLKASPDRKRLVLFGPRAGRTQALLDALKTRRDEIAARMGIVLDDTAPAPTPPKQDWEWDEQNQCLWGPQVTAEDKADALHLRKLYG
jgi:hypothetical protein